METAAAVAAFATDSDCAEACPENCVVPRAFDGGAKVDSRALEAAKLAALAEFAAGAGHEINNPLATIVGRAQALLKHEQDAGRRQSLATIAAQAFRIRDMIGDLMVFARPPAPLPQRLVLNDAVSALVERFADAASERACSLTFHADATVFAWVDPTQLNVVLSELVRNSLDAIAESSGMIELSVAAETIDSRPGSVVIVADNGRGLSEIDRAHLFDPFYSGRDAGRGLGFGLCKCWRIVANHGGRIDVDSSAGVGTTFRVFWPSPDAPPSAA
ncbi:MAG TPA: HAMP domain-containing sensor histidine kinase, partial [Planctomycetaceae bacterium]|nr:HAMP domain-containing sensor histidine kinase [Planctomycetaceae bacterium]